MNKLLLVLSVLLFSSAAMAQDGTAFFNEYTKASFYFLAVAIAAFGGTRAQSNAASVALEGMARNPSAADKLFVPMILGLALMESLVIFTLISVYLI
jgi:F-type H+-transporting ATPase subunit c